MSIVIRCPKCQAKLRGPVELAGKSVRCKGCREKFRVPGGGSDASELADSQLLSVGAPGPGLPTRLSPRPRPTPAAFIPAALAPPGTAQNPLPLDDLFLEDAPKPATPLPKRDVLDPSDLLEEPNGPASAFSFDDPAPAGRKPRGRAEANDTDRPRKRRSVEDEGEKPSRTSNRGRGGTPWAIIAGVGLTVLATGGGVAFLVLNRGKPEEAKAKIDPPLAESQPTPATKATNAAGKPTPEQRLSGGGPPTPLQPQPRKEPPSQKEPPRTELSKLPAPPAGNLTVVGKVKQRVSLDVPADKVREVRVAGSSVTVAFNSQPGFQEFGVKDIVRQYSVATGAKGRQFEIDSSKLPWPRAFAVGATDGLTAVESGGPGKMSAFDFETGTLLLDNADAFAGTTGRVAPIAALALGADRKLFVVDQAGTVDVWDLGTRVRVVTGTPPKRPATATGKPAAKACGLGDGSGVAVALDGKVWAVNAAGATVGTPVSLPEPTAVLLAFGTGAGADRAAAAYALPGGRVGVAAVRPTTGTVAYHTTLPEGALAPTAVSWPADTLLVVGTAGGAGFLADIEEQALAAYLKAPAGKTTLYPTGGDLWWLSADATDARKSTVQSVDLPFDGYFDLVKKAQADRVPVYVVPRPDGLAK